MKLKLRKWVVYLLIIMMAVPTIFLTSIAGAKPAMAATSEPTAISTDSASPTDLALPTDSATPTVPSTIESTATPTVAETPTITLEPTTLEPTTTQSLSQWTFEKVELNKEYVAPQNSGVKLTFTKLPNPSGNIKIEEITLSAEQIKQTGSLSDKAYDITSDMKDGTFTYNLSLPISESSKGKAVEVKFAEELSGIGSAAKVENTLTKTDTSVSVTSLDHFTIFVVSSPALTGAACTTAGATNETNCYSTIQAAINAAVNGDTINVAAGTYHEQVIIDKAVSVLGASAATTFIDGTGVTPVLLPGLVNITNETGAVTLDGFTIRNAPASGGTRITIWAKQAEEGPVYCSSMTITHNILVGSGHLVSTDDYGLYSKYNKSNLVFSYNDVSNFGGNAFLFELHTGPAEISHNTITVDPGSGSTAFFSMSYKDGYDNNNDVTGKQWLHDNTINANGGSAITIASAWGYLAYNNNTYGAYTNVEITDNIITNVGDAKKGIQLEVDGDNGGFVNPPIIARNTISAKELSPGPGLSRGIRIMGVVTGAQILDNGITGFYRGIYQSDSFSHLVYPAGTLISGNAITGGTYGVDIAGGTATIQLNSIVGNTLFGVNNQTVATIDATNNWWGNASGPYDNKTLPGTPNYNNPLGTGNSVTSYVDYKPWYTNAEMTTLNYMAPTFTTSAGQGKSINITFSNVQPGTSEYDVYINGRSYAIYFPTASTYNILVANYGAYSIYTVARYGSAFSTNSATQTLTLSAPAVPVVKSSVGSSLTTPTSAQAATTAPASTAPKVDEQGQIKGEETAETTDNGKINWTPWIILFILILLAGAATGGYFYWFGGDNEAEGATVAVKEKKIEEPKTAAAKKPASGTNKKSRRW